jgi:hypothetical protein
VDNEVVMPTFTRLLNALKKYSSKKDVADFVSDITASGFIVSNETSDGLTYFTKGEKWPRRS